jgi:hypothetical protein
MISTDELSERVYPVGVITGEFCMKGELHVKGVLQVALNHEDVSTVTVFNVQAQALDADNVAAQLSTPELVLLRSTCQLITFAQQLSQDELTVKASTLPAIVYTARFAVQGNLHVGSGGHLTEALDDLKAYFLPVTEVSLYPLRPARANVPRRAAVALIHRDSVRMVQSRATE